MTKAEARKLFKELKAQFAKTGIPPELDRHVWKRTSNTIHCKVCGLIKGSGFAVCEKPPQPREPLKGKE